MEFYVITIFFLNIPASILATYAGLGLLQSRQPVARILLWGTLPGLVMPLLRAIPPFGVHVPLGVLIHVLILRYLTRAKWSMCLLGSLLPNLLMVIAEGLVSVPIIYGLMGLSLAEGLQNPWVTVAGGWMSNVFIVLMCIYFYWRNRSGGAVDA